MSRSLRLLPVLCLTTRLLSGADVLDPEHWRRHGARELAPLWLRHAPDVANGGYHAGLTTDWQVQPPEDKLTAMQSRQVFGFCAAYLLSGDERYYEAARQGARFVLDHGWDAQYGGWFDALTAKGEPLDRAKSAPLQLYTNAGMTMWAFVSGDREALERVHRSVEIHRRKGWDPVYGGYVQQLGSERSVTDWGKNKHAHYGYVGSLLLNLHMADRRAETLAFSRELTDLSLERQRGPGGWLFGFRSKLDRQWRLEPKPIDGRLPASAGAQLTAALSFLRLAQQSGETRYRTTGVELGERLNAHALTDDGAWIDLFAAEPPHDALGPQRVHWWIQIYGAFLQLHLYEATGDKKYLKAFERTERFFDAHFVDREHGGVFAAVDRDGKPVGNMRKAGPWDTSYHEMEHALLNYLYLSLFVAKQPAVLHFRLDGPGEFPVSPVDAPSVRIASVTRDGEPWMDFDPAQRTVRLPEGLGQDIVVRLAIGE